MKFLLRIIPAVLLGLCFSQAASAAQASSSGSMFPEVVARVNSTPISGQDLESMIRRELASIGNPEWNNLRAEYRAELIYSGVTSLINSRLIYEKAVSSGVKVTDAEVDAEVQIIAQSYPNDAELNAALARQFLNRDSLKQKLEHDLILSKYLNSLAEAVTVAPEEISKLYAENPEFFAHPDLIRASHILLLSEEKSDLDAQVKERAEALLERAKKGEDFAKLAKENSVDGSASEGGDIGYTSKDVLDSEFADAVFSMSVGELRLIKTRYGYHVIKLIDKKPEGVAPLEDAREYLTNAIRTDKAQTELQNLLAQLQEESKVEILFSPGE